MTSKVKLWSKDQKQSQVVLVQGTYENTPGIIRSCPKLKKKKPIF